MRRWFRRRATEWCIFRQLWRWAPSNGQPRSVLVGWLIFNPGALRDRWAVEMAFRREMRRHWRDPRVREE